MASKTSVLIVDDSRSVLASLGGLFAGLDDVEIVGQATDGAEAVRMAVEHRPDLVLMDIVMPGMDGLAALRMLAAQQPGIAVAMLSSVGGRASLAEEAFRLGAIQVIGKPVDAEQLTGLVAAVREKKNGRS